MSRHDLTDEQWAVIAPLILKRQRRRGRPRNDDQWTVTGMLYVHSTGCTWNDLPKEYESASNCWHRVTEWSRDGKWDRSWCALRSHLDATVDVDWSRTFLDGSIVPIKRTMVEGW